MLSILDFLLEETPHELKQKKSGQFLPDYNEIKERNPYLTNKSFFKNKDIHISKHSRYATYPQHSHQFLELNYILQGSCRQIINGREYTLEQGDILLMDIGSHHQIEQLDYQDIVINILFKNTDISLSTLQQMQGNNSILYHILLNSHSNLSDNHNFLILRSKTIQNTAPILESMIEEYFFPKEFSQDILSHYLGILLFELARSLPNAQKKLTDNKDEPFYQALELIDKNYQTISLADAANQLKINKNYLSNLVKQKSQQTFTDLVNQKKLMTAKLLIESTELPIDSICQRVGFSNKTYFYKKFQDYFNMKPGQMRLDK